MEVGGEDVPQLPQALPIPGSLQLPGLVGQLAGRAVPGAGHRLDQVLPPLAHPVGRLPALVKLVQHLGEGSLGPAFRLRAILEDGQNGEIHRLALPHQQVRCKAIFVYIVFEFLQLRRQPLPVAAGAEGQLPRHQRRQAGEAVQQQLVPLLA